MNLDKMPTTSSTGVCQNPACKNLVCWAENGHAYRYQQPLHTQSYCELVSELNEEFSKGTLTKEDEANIQRWSLMLEKWKNDSLES